MRQIKGRWIEGYRDRWDRLHKNPDKVRWLFGDDFWEILDKHHLPPQYGKPRKG